ncbi:MAG: ROK family protein, partial [Rubrobacter sp.]|nr:ROK family protein [Rubrobacter sp.]
IGTALFIGGRLIPNSELGHIEIGGHDAEHRASDGARKRDDLNWKEYARRLDKYVTTIERLLWPDLIIVGGGISKKAKKFLPHLTARTKIVTAQMQNNAGISGAALAAVTEPSETPVTRD